MNKSITSGMLPLEHTVMDALIKAWETYLILLKSHPDQNHTDDLAEFRAGIHTCQQKLAVRVVRRDYPDYWTHSTE